MNDDSKHAFQPKSGEALLDQCAYRFAVPLNNGYAGYECGQPREAHIGTADVILFKRSGKFYTEEEWKIPADALGPADMIRSPDFRRIDDGAVLIESSAWGYPHLFARTAP